VYRGVAAAWRGRGLLLKKRSGSHLASRHPVDCVVHEEYGYVFSSVCGVDYLGGAYGRKVTIALI